MKRVPDRGELWSVNLDPTSGHEQRGMRPVLVLSPKDFNRTGLTFVAPITQGGNFARDAGFAATLTGAGTRTQGAALINQCRPVDIAARGGKFIEVAPAHIVDDALSRLHAIFE